MGGQRWRADICAHLVLVSGRCPAEPGDVAVSETDARNFHVQVGDALTVTADLSPSVASRITGIYRVDDPAEEYWFGVLPVGRSSVVDDEMMLSDDLVTVPESFATPGYQETLDVRVDRAALLLSNLADLDRSTAELGRAVAGKGRLVTGVPASLERIAQERQRAVAGLTVSLAQLAVLVAGVLALLASVDLAGQRAELGLGRLRGEPATNLRRLVAARWAAVITAGWLLGWPPGIGLLAIVTATSPGGRGLLLGPALGNVPLVVLLIMVGLIAPPARALLGQPVVSLLRSAPSAVREAGGRPVMIDIALLVVAVAGLVVAAQVGADSVLGLLVPSLVAIGAWPGWEPGSRARSWSTAGRSTTTTKRWPPVWR